MKKIIAFLLCLNIVLSAAACAPSDRPDDIDNGSLPSVSESEPRSEKNSKRPDAELYSEAVVLLEGGDLYGAYDIFLTIPEYEDVGEYLSRFSFHPEKIVSDHESDYVENYTNTTYYEYDEYGRLLSLISVDEGGEKYTISHIYDDRGNLVEDQYGGSTEYLYEYDDVGNVTKLTSPSYSNPKHAYSIEIEHDENGNITKIIADNSITEKKYNEDGKVIEISKYIGSPTTVETRYYEYNEHGDIIRNAYYENGKMISVSDTEWEYNEAGKPTKRVSTLDGETDERTEYTYYESGALKEELYFNGTDTEYAYKTEYDEKGNVSSRSNVTIYGTYNTSYFEYDKYGNPIRMDGYQIKITYFGYKLYYNPSPANPIPDELYGYGFGK